MNWRVTAKRFSDERLIWEIRPLKRFTFHWRDGWLKVYMLRGNSDWYDLVGTFKRMTSGPLRIRYVYHYEAALEQFDSFKDAIADVIAERFAGVDR